MSCTCCGVKWKTKLFSWNLVLLLGMRLAGRCSSASTSKNGSCLKRTSGWTGYEGAGGAWAPPAAWGSMGGGCSFDG
uniref:Putative secreted protein n=1 Tax=Ixodes ricinus TaxID=34613 RepID=A0A6B0U363_IXORI